MIARKMPAHRTSTGSLKRAVRFLLVALALLLSAGHARAARIVVTIDGIRSAKGDIFVALFNQATGFPDGDFSIAHAKEKASAGAVTVTFENVVPGTYAVGAYHDENGNGRLDTNLIGYPIEGYALSNGIRAVIARPRFVDASFALREESKQVTLHIKY